MHLRNPARTVSAFRDSEGEIKNIKIPTQSCNWILHISRFIFHLLFIFENDYIGRTSGVIVLRVVLQAMNFTGYSLIWRILQKWRRRHSSRMLRHHFLASQPFIDGKCICVHGDESQIWESFGGHCVTKPSMDPPYTRHRLCVPQRQNPSRLEKDVIFKYNFGQKGDGLRLPTHPPPPPPPRHWIRPCSIKHNHFSCYWTLLNKICKSISEIFRKCEKGELISFRDIWAQLFKIKYFVIAAIHRVTL